MLPMLWPKHISAMSGRTLQRDNSVLAVLRKSWIRQVSLTPLALSNFALQAPKSLKARAPVAEKTKSPPASSGRAATILRAYALNGIARSGLDLQRAAGSVQTPSG